MKGKIFNAQEVQSILNGSKVQFREVIKPQPNSNINPVKLDYLCRTWQWATKESRRECPYRVGKKIFCKEVFSTDWVNYDDTFGESCVGDISYNATWEKDNVGGFFDEPKWRPAQHMKQEHSRIILEITDVKVERLQDISEEGAIKEGVNKLFTEEEMKHVLRVHQIEKNDTYKNYLWHGHIGRTITKKQSDEWEYQCSAYEKAKDSFFSLWNATHKKPEEKFEANPFVWVVDFKIIN